MKKKRTTRASWLILAGAVAILLVGAAVTSPWKSSTAESNSAFFTVDRRDLRITVLENGSLKALKQLEIKCEVEGQTTVLALIPEGTIITQEDVDNERMLVELDSASIRDKITQQEITLQSSMASYTQAKESYGIQVNQNESNIKAGELKVKFSRMDLDKYLGAELAEDFIEQPTSFTDLMGDERLEGEALQELRKKESEIYLAKEEVKRAKEKLKWTKELCAKDFVTSNEEEADQLALDRQKIAQKQAVRGLAIFTK